MPLFITPKTIATVCCLSDVWVKEKLKDVTCIGGRYSVGSFVSLARPFKFIPQIAAAAVCDGSIKVTASLEVIEAYTARINRIPEMKARVSEVQRDFTLALARNPSTYAYLNDLEMLRGKILVQSEVMRYCLTGAGSPPDFREIAGTFALVNCTAHEVAL